MPLPAAVENPILSQELLINKQTLNDSDREKLILANIGLVHHLANRFHTHIPSVSYDELFSTAAGALVKAAAEGAFDPKKALKKAIDRYGKSAAESMLLTTAFKRYAGWAIDNALKGDYNSGHRYYDNELSRSLDEPVSRDSPEGATKGDRVADPLAQKPGVGMDKKATQDILMKAINSISLPQYREILVAALTGSPTVDEIAKQRKVTPAAISHMATKARAMLKSKLSFWGFSGVSDIGTLRESKNQVRLIVH